MNYKRRLLLVYLLVFTPFAVGIVVFWQQREQKQKTEILERRLDTYADIAHKLLSAHVSPDSLEGIFPENVRLTIIDRQGTALYDNTIAAFDALEDYTSRPEIQLARQDGRGSAIRSSASNQQKYLYYVRSFPEYYIRVAFPYNIYVKPFLQADNFFLYYVLILFIVILFFINYVAERFKKSIQTLREFTVLTENREKDDSQLSTLHSQFPKDELGEIADKILVNYQKLKESQKTAIAEREKLLQHMYSSEEGLCFFSPQRKVEFYNGLFIKYLAVIEDEPKTEPSSIFDNPLFEKVAAFLSSHTKDENYFETQISKQGKYFALRLNIFDDKSFEIVINDITKQEKNSRLKQEMTGNIAHELRTPVTSIRGYLETVLEQVLTQEQQQKFLQKAYNQTIALSQLIQDMTLLSKMGASPQSFSLDVETINLENLLEDVRTEFTALLQGKNIRMQWIFPQEIKVWSNRTLLFSVFRNLTDNVIRYAGENIDIIISRYGEDKDFHYISFADTGAGIPDEHHLNRIFERFYRVSEGRTRDTGGTGLGLSIVKNAISFHKGKIVAKNRAGGGLEFLFQLPKGKS